MKMSYTLALMFIFSNKNKAMESIYAIEVHSPQSVVTSQIFPPENLDKIFGEGEPKKESCNLCTKMNNCFKKCFYFCYKPADVTFSSQDITFANQASSQEIR